MARQERKSQRTRTRVKALVTEAGTGEQVSGFTRDISGEGLFIQTSAPLRPGTPIEVELHYPDRKIDLEGVVIRAERVPVQMQDILKPGMGVEVRPSPGMARPAGIPRNTRVPLGSDVVVFFGSERLHLELKDLSATGAALLAEEELPEMAFVRLHLKLPTSTDVIELEGVPVETRKVGRNSLIAINFLDPPAKFLSQIETLLGERGDNEQE